MERCDTAGPSHPPPDHLCYPLILAEYGHGAASCQAPNGHVEVFDSAWRFVFPHGVCWSIHTVI
jgi:hypothetical protein